MKEERGTGTEREQRSFERGVEGKVIMLAGKGGGVGRG